MDSIGNDSPGIFTEILGQAAYAFSEVQPYLPMYLHLILSALFPIYTGAYASLVRPSSAAKPLKKEKKKRGDGEQDDDDEDDEDDDDDKIQKMEGLSPSDAIVLPVLAGSTLAGLYFLIKYMGPVMINKVLNWYFSAIAIFGVAKLLNDGFTVLESFCWPDYYLDEGVTWHVTSATRDAVEVGDHQDSAACSRKSPLPGVLGRISLRPAILASLWSLRQFPSNRFMVRTHLGKMYSFKFKLTLRTIYSTALGLSVVLISNFVSKAWWLTNLQGFAFSYQALQLMSPTTFGTGSLILAALFFYDIYFVFYTPMMVSVATNLDVPIKLLFPRPAEEGETIKKMAMLGLGDVVLPGIMIGLALRFDLWMHYLKKQTSEPSSARAKDEKTEQIEDSDNDIVHKEHYRTVTGHWGNWFWTSSWSGRSRATKSQSTASKDAIVPTFRKPYFYAAITGYIVGMCATLGIMQVYQHAQPALLYLVPGVLGSLWLTGSVRGELHHMIAFSEVSDEEDDKTIVKDADEGKTNDDQESKASWWTRSFFSTASAEKNAKRSEEKTAEGVIKEEPNLGNASSQSPPSISEKQVKGTKKVAAGIKELFLFSITRISPQGSKQGNESGISGVSSSEQAPKWRGARVSEESTDERPEKRLRTS